MQRAIVYCRVSTEEQAEDGHHSLAAQESLCRRCASEKQFEIVEVFRDPGKSATTMNRPGLQDALARCQSDHSIKAVFVQDTDRLARNTKDHLTIRAMLKKHDVRLISVSQPMLEDSAEGMMIDTIIASVNQFQSDITSRKTMKGLEEKVRNGGWPALAPVGYKNVGVGPEGQSRIVVVDNESAPLVQKLFRSYATGNYSARELNDIFYKQGLRSRTGRKLQDSKIFDMLENKFYLGEVRWGGIVAKGQHEPLIDASLFAAVKAVLMAHGGNRSRKRKHDFLLRGYLFCGSCGGRLIGEKHILKGVAYYRCHKRGGCEPLCSAPELESEVADLFSHLQPSPGLLKATETALRARANAHKSNFEAERSSLLKRKAVVDTKLHKLESKWLDGLLDDADFKRLRVDLKKLQSDMENQIAGMESKRSLDYDALAEVVAFARDLGNSYSRIPDHLKRLLLKFAWERLEVANRQITVALPTMLFRSLSNFEEGSPRGTQKPVQYERASMQGGDCHPTWFPMNQDLVRLGTEWGRKPTHNRPEKTQEVPFAGNISDLMQLLDSDPGYIQHVLTLFAEIRDGMKAWKEGLNSSDPVSVDAKSIAR